MANNQIGHFLVFSRNRFFKQVFVVCQLLNSNSPVLARWLDLAALFALLTSLLMQSTSRTCNPAIHKWQSNTFLWMGPKSNIVYPCHGLTDWLLFFGLVLRDSGWWGWLLDEMGNRLKFGAGFEAQVWSRFWGSKNLWHFYIALEQMGNALPKGGWLLLWTA